MPKPFVKWVGGKTQLLNEIHARTPPDFGTPARDVYVEPFVGGGSVLFDVVSRYPDLREIHANDLNKELINAYTVVRDDVGALVGVLSGMHSEYRGAGDRAAVYYAWRDRLNGLIEKHVGEGYGDDAVAQAALFIGVMKTCFNGVCRYNRAGLFNVPHGRTANPKVCDADTLAECSTALQNVEFHLGGYADTLAYVDSRAFVYADPPYRAIPGSPSFVAYQKGGFGDDEQERLCSFLRECSNRGAKFVMSNSDPRNGDPRDAFFDDMYSWCRIDRVKARRYVNSDGAGRGDVSEIMAYN